MGIIEMSKDFEIEIKEEIQTNNYQDFFSYLGIDPKDFEEVYDAIDFDDYSR